MNKTQTKKVVATISKIEKLKFSIGDIINKMYLLTNVLYDYDVDLDTFNNDIYNALYKIDDATKQLIKNVNEKIK